MAQGGIQCKLVMPNVNLVIDVGRVSLYRSLSLSHSLSLSLSLARSALLCCCCDRLTAPFLRMPFRHRASSQDPRVSKCEMYWC